MIMISLKIGYYHPLNNDSLIYYDGTTVTSRYLTTEYYDGDPLRRLRREHTHTRVSSFKDYIEQLSDILYGKQ